MSEAGRGQPKQPVTVLVADNSDTAQRLCRPVLERAGYRVLPALDGIEAVWIAMKERPAVVWLDVAMPGINGLDSMRRIKAHLPEVPIVIASAHAMSSEMEGYVAAGAAAVLAKPFRLSDLMATVAWLVSPDTCTQSGSEILNVDR